MSEEKKITTTQLKSQVFNEVEIPQEENDDGYISLETLIANQGSTRNTADFNKGAVTSRHPHEKKFAATIPDDIIAIGGEFKFFEKKGKTPAYGWMRVRSVNINLRDGLKPNSDGSVTGLVEIKARDVTKNGKKGGRVEEGYLYLNVYPLLEGTVPEFGLTINAIKEKSQDGEFHFGPTMGTHHEMYAHVKPPN